MIVMSGESIYRLVAPQGTAGEAAPTTTPYTGSYKKRLEDPTKPTYSTFYEKGKEYDGSHARFFKQRDAVIGRNVGDSVDPKNFLKRGEGIHYAAPTTHKEKIYRKPPVNHGDVAGSGAEHDDGSRNYLQGGAGGLAGTADGGGGSGGDGNNTGDAAGRGGAGLADGTEGNAYGALDGAAGGNSRGRKDFITSNIVEVTHMVPKRRKDQPQYATSRKDFGKTPAYLSRVKGELEQEQTYLRTLETRKEVQKEQAYARYVYQLSDSEKQALTTKLKKKRDEKAAALNKMPYSKDTPSMAKYKTELEASIKDLESALAKLNREAIFIYKDDPVNGQWAKQAAMQEARQYAMEH